MSEHYSIGDTVLTKFFTLHGGMDVKGFITACGPTINSVVRHSETLYQISSTGRVKYDGFTFRTTRMVLIEKFRSELYANT
jgi:hypothetical protein